MGKSFAIVRLPADAATQQRAGRGELSAGKGSKKVLKEVRSWLEIFSEALKKLLTRIKKHYIISFLCC
ncbi:hypothetical protein [Herbaspirillum sp. RV1423]|uniref:hypothetical protein n=1 Tax=Herbaspirillum sp. RV1423 TaxID=1443993 RepID=UPI0012DF61FB|nr:hypothetical protein [Herbaspirillum sp. RV1423]